MKIKLLGLAALAIASLLVVPVSAEEKAAAKKVMLKEKYEAGLVITETALKPARPQPRLRSAHRAPKRLRKTKKKRKK
jgi:hypothetical protein